MADVPRVEALAAALRRDLDDLDMYAHFLKSTLEAALPAGILEIERKQSLGDKLKGRPGTVERLVISLGDLRFLLLPHRGAPRAQVIHVVKGMELDHDDVGLDEWITRLAASLTTHAETSARATAVLADVTDPTRSL